MKNLVLCVTLNFLFFINIVYSAVTPVNTPVHFTLKQSFKLECNVTYEGNDPPKIQWNKDGEEVTLIKGLKDRAKSTWNDSKKINILTVDNSVEDDTGNYSCAVLDEKNNVKEQAEFTASRPIIVKVPSNVNVVEEEKLTIECKTIGSPRLRWRFKDEIYESSRGVVILGNFSDNGKHIENGVFIIEKIQKEDRGNVTCIGVDIYNTSITEEDTCMVRIRDKYAALWPFLGICAEVIVLCAIIIIYEKKRNKTELDESDTDQSPDQKNTPDHGKEANLRHRQ